MERSGPDERDDPKQQHPTLYDVEEAECAKAMQDLLCCYTEVGRRHI
jgi:hypothetical protein